MLKPKDLDELKESIPCSIHDPNFYPQLFAWMEQKRLKNLKNVSPVEQILLDQQEALSKQMDRSVVQEGASARNLLKARALAEVLIDDDGELDETLVKQSIQILNKNLFFVGPGRQHEGRRQRHMLRVLETLGQNEELKQRFKKFSKPFRNLQADQLIRDTLLLREGVVITDAHTRRAVLAAWLTFLRQNVGSCFATAPAIMIHTEQPHRFLDDIDELLGTGRLKRTYEGIEYAVPLSPSWGVGDVLRTFLISQNAKSGVPIWESPGVVQGLRSAGVLKEEEGIKETKVLIENIIPSLLGKNNAGYISVKRLIEVLLLQELQLTDEDIEECNRRPQPMVVAEVGMAVMGKGVGKDQRCRSYKAKLEAAIKGFKAVTDNALLKAWEFTLASLSETKHDFSTWNLYSSLGMKSDDVNGIGGALFEIFSQKVEEYNREVERHEEDIAPIYHHVKALEGRLQRASSEDEVKWLRSEYQSRVNEMRTVEELRDKAHRKASLFSQLFDFLIGEYLDRFKDYFQEIYDADMHDVTAGPYDDSPAGFRLLYKHGRATTTAWTMIHTPSEFIDAICGFFTATENEIVGLEELEPIQREVSQVMNQLIIHLRTPEFIESAFHRMANIHGQRPIANPLEHLDQIEKKPWAYTSGGTMNHLISCYYCRSEKPKLESRWIEEPMELLVFLLDLMKAQSSQVRSQIEKNPELPLLMHSPTHAFLFKPGWAPFSKGWLNEVYTYTWVRDRWISPHIQRWSNYRMDGEVIRFLYEKLVSRVPENYRQIFERSFAKLPNMATPREFREYVMLRMQKEKGLRIGGHALVSEEDLDELLYNSLPIFEQDQVPYQLRKLLPHLSVLEDEDIDRLLELYDQFHRSSGPRLVTSEQLQQIAKSLIIMDKERVGSEINLHEEIASVASEQGLAMPQPILFADTNWVKECFAFIFNPGTEQLELWRTNEVGRAAVPMHSWRRWVDGSVKKPDWGVLSDPMGYWNNIDI